MSHSHSRRCERKSGSGRLPKVCFVCFPYSCYRKSVACGQRLKGAAIIQTLPFPSRIAMLCCLPEEIIPTVQLRFPAEAFVGQRLVTLAAPHARRMPAALEHVEQEFVQDRFVAAGARIAQPGRWLSPTCGWTRDGTAKEKKR